MKQRQWLRNEICIQRAWPSRAGLSRVVPTVLVLPMPRAAPVSRGQQKHSCSLVCSTSGGWMGSAWVGLHFSPTAAPAWRNSLPSTIAGAPACAPAMPLKPPKWRQQHKVALKLLSYQPFPFPSGPRAALHLACTQCNPMAILPWGMPLCAASLEL